MRKLIFTLCVFYSGFIRSQELFISTEPASNMPARAIGFRLNNFVMPGYTNPVDGVNHAPSYRFNPELMWGISKNSMLHINFYMSNMQQSNFSFEGGGFYYKYRFLSIDNNKRHFRMAAYAKGSIINNPINYNEINLGGDNSGATVGIVATQLLHKLAISITSGYVQGFNNTNNNFLPGQSKSAINYSLSLGYLLFPVEYKNYDQPNLNIYAEFLGKYNPQTSEQFVDFAPGIQLIFKSKMRLDFSYRRQLTGNMFRINNQEFILKFEYNIFNAYKSRSHG